MRLFILLLLAVLGALWFLGLRRARTLFLVSIANKKARLVRGRIPPRLLSDMDDIAARAGDTEGDVECVVSDGAPSLVFRGTIGLGTQQQLRNVLAGFSAAQLRAGRPR